MALINVFSYNLRCDVESDGINAFSRRKSFVKERLEFHKPDLIGFQEVLPHMLTWLKQNLIGYTVVGTGRDADLTGEATAVAFKTDLFEMISLETFWLSDTPSIPGSHFNTDQSSCNRVCTCVTLKHRDSEKPFRIFNTHLDHVGQMAQVQGMTVIFNKMMEYNAKLPLNTILTGDFNNYPDSILYKSIKNFAGIKLTDVTSEINGTFHGFGKIAEPSKIDYIFTDAPCDIKKSSLITDENNGIFMSDHYPVKAEIEV